MHIKKSENIKGNNLAKTAAIVSMACKAAGITKTYQQIY
jgi:hypothetical protein